MSRLAVTIDTLASFLPRWVRRSVGESPQRIPPVQRQLTGAGLFVDLAGFTTLTDSLARQGVSGGAERLTVLLDQYFGQLISVAWQWRGDVAAFVGDAMLVVWRGDPAEMMVAAAACALDIRNAVNDTDFGEGVKIQQRISVGAGAFDTWELGTPERRLSMLRGQVMEQLGQTLGLALPGQIRVAVGAAGLARNRLKGTEDSYGVLLEGMEGVVETPGRPGLPFSLLGPSDSLRPYIPPVVAQRLDAGLPARHGQFRTVTAVFVSLVGLPDDRLQQATCSLLDVAAQHGGHVSQLLHDEKGTTLVLAFGVPLMSHEDDAARGVHAGIRCREVLAELGCVASVGIATGRVFCGAYGNDNRRHYDCIGAAMNLAARLMVAAKGRILCEAATVRSTRGGQGVRFEAAGVVTVKGREQPVSIYIPGRSVHRNRPRLEVIGRVPERATLKELVGGFLRGGASLRVRVEGEPGIGKSVVQADLVEQLRGQGVVVVTGAGSAMDHGTPLAVWRSLWRGLVDADPRFSRDPERREPRYLLEGDSPRTDPGRRPGSIDTSRRTMPPTAVDATPLDRLLSVLRRPPGLPPLVIAIDDAHWMDASSLEILRALAERVPNLGLVLTSLPDNHPWKGWQRLRLGSLSEAENEALVCRRLGVSEIPPLIKNFVWSRAEGHPFFSEELAQTLRDEGVISVEDGECLLIAPEMLQRIAFPSSVEGLITARIDSLSPAAQQALQVASVLGRYFRLSGLEQLLELPNFRVAPLVEELMGANLVVLHTVVPEPIYGVRHAIVQDVAYNQLLFAARRRYHQKAAEWMEQETSEGDPGLYSLLAHHWSRAQDPGRAMNWLERAGTHALETRTLPEARAFFADALQLASRPEERWRMHQYLGQIANMLREPRAARQHLEESLALRGGGRPSVWRRLRGQAGALLGRRLGPPDSSTCGAHQSLAEVAWMELDEEALQAHALAAWEAAESPGEEAQAEAIAAVALQSRGWTSASRRFREMAVERFLPNPLVLAHIRLIASIQVVAGGEPAAELLEQVMGLAHDEPVTSGQAGLHLAILAMLRGQPTEGLARLEGLGTMSDVTRTALDAVALAVRLGCGSLRGAPALEDIDQLEALLEASLPRLDAVMGHAAVAGALMVHRSPGPARFHAEQVLKRLQEGVPLAWPLIWALNQVSEALELAPEHRPTLARLWQQLAVRVPLARPWRTYWESRVRPGGRALRLAQQAWNEAQDQPLIRGYAARRCLDLLPSDSPGRARFAADVQRLEATWRALIP